MNSKDQKVLISTFEKEVSEGLTAFPKYLSSKFFYDEVGDELFQQIMALSEYYLTRAEYEIFETHKSDIIRNFDEVKEGFDLIELGAGDGKKTKVLLQELLNQHYDFTYNPIDISENAIDGLVKNLNQEMPEVTVQGQIGEYFEVLDRLKHMSDRKKVIMVLGSNIGNLLHPRAIQFLKKLHNAMHTGDLLFIGFDQKKHPQKVLDAYNDKSGITAAFNKNVLARINKELNGNFDLDKFMHWETYDPENGTAKSYLVSKEKQTVDIDSLSLQVHFEAWESIHTEISQKYDDDIVKWLAKESGLKIVKSFSDQNNNYKDYLITK
ncbi:dimethylhistidine N-methyltransferase [Aquimarina sp. MAR_2010_214]|uniref:L-histidine N(alpha)-methyltransferase n=1 Tax=Aquimarina sp. MAR_2010_214 TaxID=1250026 RepID=UPI000C70B7B3|nr:L-histidine N(alpha)-methyltransferase [Aquimarina sp. MAR_2010_214]PKV49562.1 dimethylhistidine N-methyltransferase [Aquimarina sp. MAR_2010_214]